MDEVWIKVAKRDEPSMEIKVLDHKERGFNPSILTSDLLSTYRAIANYFSGCLHQLCTNHARRIITRIIKAPPNRKGKIEVGKDADLVILDGDWSVWSTIVQGKVVFHK